MHCLSILKCGSFRLLVQLLEKVDLLQNNVTLQNRNVLRRRPQGTATGQIAKRQQLLGDSLSQLLLLLQQILVLGKQGVHPAPVEELGGEVRRPLRINFLVLVENGCDMLQNR